jgi:curved DNA-binding protein CbpA
VSGHVSLDSVIHCGTYSRAIAIKYDPKADYYALLCVEVSASREDIKKAHRARISELHPDRGGDPAHASAVNVARDVLTDPDSRREYDKARRDWIVECLQSPLVRAFFDADGRLSASLNAQGTATSAAGAPSQRPTAADPETHARSARRRRAPSASSTPPFTREEIKAAAARLNAKLSAERDAEQKARATGQASRNASRPHGARGKPAGRWSLGIVSGYAWDDVCKVVGSGDWLGAIGLLGTALFVDRAIHQQANAAELATLDAAVAEKRRERAIAFIEQVAGALGAHFGLDRNEVAARAGAAARAVASSASGWLPDAPRAISRKHVRSAAPVAPVRVSAR